MGLKIKSWSREEHKAKTIFYYIGVVVLCFVVIGMLVDFINWKEAISMIKKEIPIESNIARPTEFVKGIGWIPVLWRGNFQRITVTTKGNSGLVGDINYVVLQIGNHETFFVNLESGYGSKTFKNDSDNAWKNQEFDNAFVFTKIYVQEIKNYEAKVRILVYMETESRHYIRQVYATLKYKGCGGGYWIGGWVK